ncbi:hypothetical protein GTH50_04190 [Lactobacillus gasseri]|jgi:hypothetical protein|uniref:hypothetical protein n=1 Tax=Lactobacillus gasseri TaxID=1596 RepID=UPI00139B3ADD|nr:hypothetical protein [Lactobacillus gasseri]MYM17494.1 hypothetical protein [Lactobacillus gasseri]QTP20205.1 hypothetical protein J7S35_000665 [Lactobacillus gasseri]DAE66946.1 MAG TPA: hypothetical protein [Caudoviricetes sp.]
MEEKKISIDKEILKMIEHTANIAAMTGSRKNYGIYISTISSLSNVLTVLGNLEKEPSNKIKVYGSGQISAEIEDK